MSATTALQLRETLALDYRESGEEIHTRFFIEKSY